MKYFFLILIITVQLNGCNVYKDYSFDNFTLKNCLGDSKTFILPAGWSKKDSHYTGHGNIESLIYPDSSVVMILCAASTELVFGDKFNKSKKSRKEIIFGRTIIYENVPANRKKEFDAAFEQMMKNKPAPYN